MRNFILPIFGFIFYRISFKIAFAENISLIADALITLGLFFASVFIGFFFVAAYDLKDSQKAYNIPQESRLKIRPSFGLIAAAIIFSLYAIGIIYGFSDNLYDEIRYADLGYSTTLFILTVPLIAYYFVVALSFRKL